MERRQNEPSKRKRLSAFGTAVSTACPPDPIFGLLSVSFSSAPSSAGPGRRSTCRQAPTGEAQAVGLVLLERRQALLHASRRALWLGFGCLPRFPRSSSPGVFLACRCPTTHLGHTLGGWSPAAAARRRDSKTSPVSKRTHPFPGRRPWKARRRTGYAWNGPTASCPPGLAFPGTAPTPACGR